MSDEAWPRYFHPDGHEITAEEFDAAYDEAQAPRGNSIMSTTAPIGDYPPNYYRPPLAPINEAGITATFAAIFARLDALEAGGGRCHPNDPAFTSIRARLSVLESAHIAAPVAPESAETASGVPVEPGNATAPMWPPDIEALNWVPEKLRNDVAAALRMYRKVQGCEVVANSSLVRSAGRAPMSPQQLLAWLKEGEA
jgi:hypothetical protein